MGHRGSLSLEPTTLADSSLLQPEFTTVSFLYVKCLLESLAAEVILQVRTQIRFFQRCSDGRLLTPENAMSSLALLRTLRAFVFVV